MKLPVLAAALFAAGGGALPIARVRLDTSGLGFAAPDPSGSRGLEARGTVSGTATDKTPSIYEVNLHDQSAAMQDGYIDGYRIAVEYGGSNFAGLHTVLHSLVAFTGTPSAGTMNADVTTRDLVSNLAEGYADASWGGRPGVGNARGNLTGYNSNVRLSANVGDWNILAAGEFDVQNFSVTLFRKYGMLWVQGNGDRPATGEEAWQLFSGGDGSAGMANLLLLGSRYGNAASPLAADGCVLCASLNAAGQKFVTAARGIDLRNLMMPPEGVAFASEGFLVDGRGNAAANSVRTQVVVGGTNGALTLGTTGPAGGAVVVAGAQADGSVVRPTLTGAPYTVPTNTGWVKARQTNVLPNQAITLPPAQADGQMLRISSLGAIGRLTVVPPPGTAVVGAPTALGANGMLLFAWDAVSAAWERQIPQ